MQVFKIPFHLNATSIDLCGRYVIVGCDNGDILCKLTVYYKIYWFANFFLFEGFANDVNSKKYIVIGQMASKVFSNLQTSVVICSDQTMCFAGTRKGKTSCYKIWNILIIITCVRIEWTSCHWLKESAKQQH